MRTRATWSRATSICGLGKTEVKGVSEALSIYQVVGIGALRGHFELAERRRLTKFAGREHELQQRAAPIPRRSS